MWRALLLCIIILGSFFGLYVYGSRDMVDSIDMTTLIPCGGYKTSGEAIRITEVGFDGSDEWLEIMNIGSETYSGNITISGAKSTPFTIPIYLDPGNITLIGDQIAIASGYDLTLTTGLGLSLSDSTGFSLTLMISGSVVQIVSFSHDQIVSIPNHISLEGILSGDTLIWSQTSDITTWYDDTGEVINPGLVRCLETPEITLPLDTGLSDIVSSGNIDSGSENIFEETGGILDFSGDFLSGEDIIYSGLDNTLIDEDTGGSDLFSGDNNTSGDIFIVTGDIDSGVILIGFEFSQPPIIDSIDPLPCTISEIHSVNDSLPEYIEIYCSQAYSGIIYANGIGIGSAIKSLPVYTSGGSYLLFTSYPSSFSTSGSMLVAGLSLRDDGETISLFASGYTTLDSTFPKISEGKSYYPSCEYGVCIALSSPFTTQPYTAPTISPVISIQQTPVSSPSLSTITTGSYYEKLYHTRKDKATEYQKHISSLTATIKTLQKPIASTSQKNLITKKKKTSSTSGVTASKSKVTSNKPTTPKKESSPKTTSSSKKTPTISTTSKKYIQLVDEHKAYKGYITFMNDYLKGHLYTQYTTLHISDLQKLLQNTLKYIKTEKYTISLSGGRNISIFDYNSQLLLSQKSSVIDHLYTQFWSHVSPLLSVFQGHLLEHLLVKYTL